MDPLRRVIDAAIIATTVEQEKETLLPFAMYQSAKLPRNAVAKDTYLDLVFLRRKVAKISFQ